MSKYIDFSEIKRRCDIEDVAAFLQLKTKREGSQLRAACPACKSDRVLSINVDEESWYCHAAKRGGDLISLVAHVQGLEQKGGMRKAAEILQQEFGESQTAPRYQPRKEPEPGREEFQALDYLVFEHEAIHALGLLPATAKALGIGFANKGSMRGCVCIPVYLPGAINPSGYFGLDLTNGEIKLPKEWHGIPKPIEADKDTNVVPFKKKVV